VFHPLGVRRFIVNWEEVSQHLLRRAERELAQFQGDEIAAALLNELREHHGRSIQTSRSGAIRPADLLLPVHVKKDDVELRIFSTIMTLGTPQDVTLQELRIETFFPADPASELQWKRMTD
jgi:hypothetical protein